MTKVLSHQLRPLLTTAPCGVGITSTVIGARILHVSTSTFAHSTGRVGFDSAWSGCRLLITPALVMSPAPDPFLLLTLLMLLSMQGQRTCAEDALIDSKCLGTSSLVQEAARSLPQMLDNVSANAAACAQIHKLYPLNSTASLYQASALHATCARSSNLPCNDMPDSQWLQLTRYSFQRCHTCIMKRAQFFACAATTATYCFSNLCRKNVFAGN